MGTLEEIRELLKQFTAGEIQTFPAEVVSVDTGNYTAIVKPVSDPELKVRLKAAINDKKAGFVLIPQVGSTVLVALILNKPDSGYICAIDEVASVEIRSESIQMNNGENGGLCITPELKTQLDVMTARIDTIVDAIKNGVPVATDGGLAYQESMGVIIDANPNKEDFSNIENNQITH